MRLYTFAFLLLGCLAIIIGCASPGASYSRDPSWPPPSVIHSPAPDRYRPDDDAAWVDGLEKPAALPELDDSATLDDYLRYAALNNPELRGAFYRWKSAIAATDAAGYLPDPRFTYRYFGEPMSTRQEIELMQSFPWFGTLQLRKDAAAERAKAEGARFEAARRKLMLNVERAYYDYYFLGRTVSITGENAGLLRLIEGVVRVRVEAAVVDQSDLLRIQMELARLDDRLRTLNELRRASAAELNALLNRPAESALPWPASVNVPELADDAEQFREGLSGNNPELAATDFEIEARNRQADLALKRYWPDLMVGAMFMEMDMMRSGIMMMPDARERNAWGALVSLNLPIWRQAYAAGVRQAQQMVLAESRMRQGQLNRLTAQLERALYDYRDARRRMALYKDNLLPTARQSFETIRAGYQGGQRSFTDLIGAQRILLEFDLALEKARVDAATAAARVRELTGSAYTADGIE